MTGCKTCKHNRKRTIRNKHCLKNHRAVFGYNCKDIECEISDCIRRGKMDSCVLCGDYAGEGRQICPTCELTKPKELVQIMSKKTDTIIIPGELPDLNQIIAASKNHWSNYSYLKKTNTLLVAYHAKKTTKQKYEKIDLDITWYCKNKMKDKDNIMAGGLKMILDGLVVAGVIKNDGWSEIGSINNHFEVDKDNPRVEIKITEVAG